MTALAQAQSSVAPVAPALKRTSSAPTMRRRWRFAGGLTVVAAAVIAHGNNRQPAGPAHGVGLYGAPTANVPTDRLRVASFNIHGGRDGQDHRDLSRTAVSLQGVHLAGLNEVRGGWRGDQTRYLAQRHGLAWLYAPSERRWWREHWGNALLSAAPVTSWRRTPLVGTRGKGFRNFLVADVAHFGATIQVLLTHVDTSQDREAQLQTIFDTFLNLPQPALLLGDLNSDANDPQMQRLLASAGVVDCLADAARNYPRRRIDWIVARGLRTLDAGMRDDLASDHPCFWADLAPLSSELQAP